MKRKKHDRRSPVIDVLLYQTKHAFEFGKEDPYLEKFFLNRIVETSGEFRLRRPERDMLAELILKECERPLGYLFYNLLTRLARHGVSEETAEKIMNFFIRKGCADCVKHLVCNAFKKDKTLNLDQIISLVDNMIKNDFINGQSERSLDFFIGDNGLLAEQIRQKFAVARANHNALP
jgi:hypothetical protein